jgi:gamma-glutamylcyclotransferase (GGCT)/AIG2-like uncharacterized protein YtfP
MGDVWDTVVIPVLVTGIHRAADASARRELDTGDEPRYDSGMNPHLFVYGSLMSTARHPMGERLRADARLIGPATIQGRLYRVSWYPGAADSTGPEQRVHGEVYALEAPGRALAWLDAYEGIVPGSEDAGEYRRLERPARLATGEVIAAWVYLYQKDTSQLPFVADGRWTASFR